MYDARGEKEKMSHYDSITPW